MSNVLYALMLAALLAGLYSIAFVPLTFYAPVWLAVSAAGVFAILSHSAAVAEGQRRLMEEASEVQQ